MTLIYKPLSRVSLHNKSRPIQTSKRLAEKRTSSPLLRVHSARSRDEWPRAPLTTAIRFANLGSFVQSSRNCAARRRRPRRRPRFRARVWRQAAKSINILGVVHLIILLSDVQPLISCLHVRRAGSYTRDDKVQAYRERFRSCWLFRESVALSFL